VKEEEEERRRQERLRKEEEEYQQWKQFMAVEGSGTLTQEQQEKESRIEEFITFVKVSQCFKCVEVNQLMHFNEIVSFERIPLFEMCVHFCV
jgi:hypothetical protein